MGLYTKDGRSLQVSNDKVYSRSGIIVGRINGDKVYGTDEEIRVLATHPVSHVGCYCQQEGSDV